MANIHGIRDYESDAPGGLQAAPGPASGPGRNIFMMGNGDGGSGGSS